MTEGRPEPGTENPGAVSSAVLAYIGDAVYERYVRLHVFHKGILRPDRLNTAAVGYVRAEAQARAFDLLQEYLTEEELAAARRGKNHKITSMPKNVDPKIYKKATGFEALIGFLEVSGADGRLEEIIEKTFEIIENEKIIVNRR
ncbi:MAG: Mini-ribonuclease 3 [Anaerovoracaceae bacterium]